MLKTFARISSTTLRLEKSFFGSLPRYASTIINLKLRGQCIARNLNCKWASSSPHKKTPINIFPYTRGFTTSRDVYSATSKLFTMKLDTPEFHSLFTPELKALIDLFAKYKHELRIAGGAVRDLIRGLQSHDVDFATTATPTEMKEMFEKEGIRMINTKGEKHGTITCRIMDKENFEVTTLRIDVTTDGRHAEVQFTKDWQLDSLRRDLTINSMFLGFDGTVYDYYNGYEDLLNNRVRFVGNPVERIQEDYLRILRYFRFYGRIAKEANNHEAASLDAIRHNVDGLAGISGERIWMELKKIVTGGHAADNIRIMIELGMGPFIGLPASSDVNEFGRVMARCCDLDPHPMTVLPALLTSEDELYKFNERMKMSRDELRLGLFIINHRCDNPGSDHLRYCQDLHCDTSGKEPKTHEKICELLKYTGHRDTLGTFKAWQPPRFPVNGHRLLEAGVKKGPALAKTLSDLREKWKESAYTYTEDELMEYVEEIKQKYQ